MEEIADHTLGLQNREELLELQLPGHKLPILKMTKDERIKYAPIRSHDDWVLPVYGEEDQRVPKTWELTLLDP